jgi:site-specific recombinase XerD
MSTPLPAHPSRRLTQVDDLARAAQTFASNALGVQTKKAYRSDWEDFTRWCADHQSDPLPASPTTVALYLTDRAQTLKVSSLRRRQTSISQAHKLARLPSPTTSPEVRQVMTGIIRTLGEAPNRKLPALAEIMHMMLNTLPDTLPGIRNRALLLLGYAGALRRSELVALTANDLEFTPEGLKVHIRRSKTDPTGLGQTIGVLFGSEPQTCPIRSLQSWMRSAGIHNGPLFRPISRGGRIGPKALTPQSVALIVKQTAQAAGLDPAPFAGHSLRAGFATQAARAGALERHIQRTTRHRSEKVLRTYIREGELFRENAGDRLGL